MKPEKMSGELIPDSLVKELIAMADWAPTHARTEPWRFIVFNSALVSAFCESHANLYKNNPGEVPFNQVKYNNLLHAGDNASHVIVAYMKRVASHKIPEIEEIAAASCAVQNLLLAATANGIVSFWSTSGMTHHEAFKEHFDLEEEDRVLGLLYLGYSNEPVKEGFRTIPLAEKVRWVTG